MRVRVRVRVRVRSGVTFLCSSTLSLCQYSVVYGHAYYPFVHTYFMSKCLAVRSVLVYPMYSILLQRVLVDVYIVSC